MGCVEMIVAIVGCDEVVGVVELVVVIVIFIFIWYPFMASVYL